MSALDIFLLVPIVWLAFKGFGRGAVYEASSLIGLLLGIYLANLLAANVAARLGIEGPFPVLAAFLLILVGIVLLSRIIGRLAARALKLLKLGAADKIAGTLLGVVKALALVGVLIYYVETIDRKHVIITPKQTEQSILYRPVNTAGNLLIGSVKHFVSQHQKP